MSIAGNRFRDVSVASVSAAQAAGTATVVDVNRARVALVIVPPVDCLLKLSAAGSSGLPLYGGVPNSFVGEECPTNPLYISGLSVGQAVTIWEA